ncbi:glycoside hydrolase family 19 protein [Roseomonas sp. M0104]|uniref:Glycoside hydrolase family 19 protein n=1 Tax=Teichococcus coralli TaxID=2545983 RepID=A0A845BER9_9PROT|nr:glycoside hydrolase family 19 protein [Pseudoroseomonas coralli]MXP61979.1 glycoside hydrolase family 19 protein [Pseudoroseomonas coralli]
MLSASQLRRLYPAAHPDHLAAFAAEAAALFRLSRLDAARQRCHFFLAQLGHESCGLQVREEALSYSAARLMQVWPGRFPTPEAAEPFARAPEKLAEAVYGGRMGNDRPGDGFRYRGRGYIQLTGRDAYRQVGQIARLPLEEQPDLANHPAHALAAACAFWRWKRLNPLCDQGDFPAVTRRINGGLVGLQDRFAWLERAQRCIPWEENGPLALTVKDLKAVQTALRARGLYDGSIDGIIGRRSLAAIATLRAEEDLPDGSGVDLPVMEALGLR